MKNNQNNGATYAEKMIARNGEFILRHGALMASDIEHAASLAGVIEISREIDQRPQGATLYPGLITTEHARINTELLRPQKATR